jgi:O-antigen ligase
MLNQIFEYLKNLRQISFLQGISFFLGLILLTAVPYSAGFCKDWYIQIGASYRLNFFYGIQFILYGILLLHFRYSIKTSFERWIYMGLLATLLARILSLIFAVEMEKIQLLSLVRYMEVFLCIYCLTNLWEDARNRLAFLSGLFVAVVIECLMGYAMFIVSGGFLRGIFTGVPAYQMLVLFSILMLLEAKHDNWLKLTLISCLLLLGIVGTQTRSALLQLIIGVGAVGLLSLIQGYFQKFILVATIPLLFVSGLAYLQNSQFQAAKSRLAEAYIESHVKTTETDEGVSSGTLQWRYFLWDKSLGAFKSHPITGIGSGGFPRQLPHLPQVFGVRLDRVDKNMPLSTHNTFLGVLSETGLIGVLAYLIWIIGVARVAWVCFFSTKDNSLIIGFSILIGIFIFSDFWSQQSFIPNMSFSVAFLLGYLRQSQSE